MATTHAYWYDEDGEPRVTLFDGTVETPDYPLDDPNVTALPAGINPDFATIDFLTRTITPDVPAARAAAIDRIDRRWQELGNGPRMIRRQAEYSLWTEAQDFQTMTQTNFNAMTAANRRDRWPRLSELVTQTGGAGSFANVTNLTNALEAELRASIFESAELDISAQLARRAATNAATVDAALAAATAFEA